MSDMTAAATSTRPPHEHAIEHAIRYGTSIAEGDFILKAGARSSVQINIMRLVHQPKRMQPIYGHWAYRWFDRGLQADNPRPRVLFGYGDEGTRLGFGLKRYLNQEYYPEVLADSHDDIVPGRLRQLVNGLQDQPTLILMGVLETERRVSWLIRQANDSGANLLGVAAIASLDPAITADSLGISRLTVGWQLDCLLDNNEGADAR